MPEIASSWPMLNMQHPERGLPSPEVLRPGTMDILEVVEEYYRAQGKEFMEAPQEFVHPDGMLYTGNGHKQLAKDFSFL